MSAHSVRQQAPDASDGGRLARLRLVLCAAVLAALAPGGAHAKSHLWRFTEIFSSADGSVQFVEMQVLDPAGTAEWNIVGMELSSNANSYIFPNNLPQENTFERWMLVATQAFADLPGAPVPDYILPENFFDPAGDELRYRQTRDIFPIPPGAMPTNGVHSLEPDLSTPVNSPTNFAGDTGSVVVPGSSAVPAAPHWGVWAGALLVLAAGGLALGRAARAQRAT